MTNQTETRDQTIAAITIGLLLFFGAVSFTLGYIATRAGLLFDGGGAIESTVASTATH